MPGDDGSDLWSREWTSPQPLEQQRLDTLSRLVSVPPSPQAACDALAGLAADLCGAQAAALTVHTAHQAWPLAAVGSRVDPVPRAETVGDVVVRSARPLLVPDLRADPATAGRREASDFRSLACVPVTAPGGAVLGAAWVAACEPAAFTPEHLAVLDATARRFATSLAGAREHRQAEAAEAERRDRGLRDLLSLAEVVPGAGTVAEVFDVLLQHVRALLPVDDAAVLLADDEERTLQVVATLGTLGSGIAGAALPVGVGLTGGVAADRRARVVEDLGQDGVEDPLLAGTGLRSAAAAPVVAAGRLVGVLLVAGRSVGQVDRGVLPLVDRLAGHLAQLVTQVRLRTQLRSHRDRLAVLLDTVVDPVWTLQPVLDDAGVIVDFRVLETNRAHRSVGGTPVGELARMQDRSPELFDLFCRVARTGQPESVHRLGIGAHPTVRGTPARWLDGRAARVDDDLVVGWRDVTAQVLAEDALRRQAFHDALTDLPNRTLLMERLRWEIDRLPRTENALAVITLDLDRFKDVNDAHGHAAGDSLLVEVAARITASVRAQDVAARLAGDEFAILCPDVTGAHDAQAVAERVLAALAGPVEVSVGVDGGLGSTSVQVGASAGVAVTSTADVGPEQLLQQSDEAMYVAKRHGGQRVESYRPSMDTDARARLAVEADLHAALEHGWFRLHYQPVVDLRDGTVLGAEALLRLDHPERGLLGAGEFIDVAEATHLVVPIGEWVVAQACRQLAAWRCARPLVMGVNVSARHAHRIGLSGLVDRVLAETGVDPSHLSLEVTERVFLHADDAVVTDLETLRTRGVHLALDDFGTGQSSLDHLRRFPVTALKIDRAFVAGLPDQPRETALVDAVVALGRALDLHVVAEGVETEQQREHLLRAGCTVGQGFLFAPALDPDAFAALLTG